MRTMSFRTGSACGLGRWRHRIGCMAVGRPVLSFSRTLGPTAPKPTNVISEAHAKKAAGGKPDRADLVWALEPPGSQTWQLAWRLDYANVQPNGESLPCVVWLAAGSGAQLDVACVM